MTTFVSTQLRVFGGASVMALSIGLTPQAFAQAASASGVIGCNQDGDFVSCPSGLDPDGFALAEDGITLRVETGARIEGEINLLDDANVTVDGEVVVTTFESAIDLGANAVVVNNGTLEANPVLDGVISVEANGDVTNNGTVTSRGNDLVGGIVVASGTTVVNAGTIELEGSNIVGVVGGLTLEESDISVTNSADGVISIDTGTAGIGAGILLDDNVTVINEGLIETSGEDTYPILVGNNATITNSGTIRSTGETSSGVTTEGNAVVTNTVDGTISTTGRGSLGVLVGNDSMVTNDGVITTSGTDAIGVFGFADTVITNSASGEITTNGESAQGVLVANGSTVINAGTIQSAADHAIDARIDATITNTGLIQSNASSGIELNSGTITNSGTIESLSSDPDGDFILDDAGNPTMDRAIDAAINFVSSAANNEDGVVTNLAGGVIVGDIGITTSSRTTGLDANEGAQQVINFGTITGRAINPETGRQDAIRLGEGDDEFQQWTGAAVNGAVDLEAGNDTFILEGTSSSITGLVDGGEGDDIAILAGTLDSDNIVGFETIQLGSQLGDTLNDLDISGNRTVSGDVVHVGVVNIELGVDSLTTDGSITLEETGVLNIATSQGQDLVGQTVLVLQDGAGFTDNGASVNILDNDLLIDYTPVIGSLSVAVSSVNPLAGNSDPNLAGFGDAADTALAAGTLGADTFDALNALDAVTYTQAANDALPSLNEGLGREIFESGTLASQALDRHLAGEGSGVWGQIAVRSAEQDAASSSVDGYESDQLVFTVGGDLALGDNVRVGLLASYADIDVDDETAAGVETGASEIDSIRLGAYAAAEFVERGFINAEISYLTGEIDSTRGGFFGPINSSYDFDGVAGRVVIGYDVLGSDTIALTPTIGLNAASISFDDASESGGFDFLVQREDADFLEARIGAQLSGDFSDTFSGFVQGVYAYDLEDDARAVSLSSSQLPTFGATIPGREQNRFELSAGATFNVDENIAIGIGYLGDFADGYDAHSGRANVRIAF